MSLPAGIRIAWRAVPPGALRREVSRAVLADLLPGASFIARCPSCGGDHGRIRVDGVDAAVSVSYAPGWTVVAVTSDHTGIGVDAVPADAVGLERVLPDAVDARAWARAEAVLKADGRGLRVDPSRVRVDAAPDGWVARIAESDGPDQDAAAIEWRGWDLDGPTGVVGAVAVR